jgi:hypothetical protein
LPGERVSEFHTSIDEHHVRSVLHKEACSSGTNSAGSAGYYRDGSCETPVG